jgi:hypothetical protein
VRYSLRIVREVGTRNITVYPVKPCRNDQKPYHTRTSGVCVEVLRVFETKEAAAAAAAAEQMVADLAALPDAELVAIVNADVDYLLREVDIQRGGVARIMGISIDTYRKMREGKISPNPRAAARLRYAASRIRRAIERAAKLLPEDASTGQLNRRLFRASDPPQDA